MVMADETKTRMLVLDDEQVALRNLQYILTKAGYDVVASQSGVKGLELIANQEFDVVLTDLKMPKVDGFKILQRVRETWPDTEVIIITGYATIDSAVEAIKMGAFHYISKPYQIEEVRRVVQQALERRNLKKDTTYFNDRLERLKSSRIITEDPVMLKLLATAQDVAQSDCNVLITGESGTGKELLANFIHENSPRAKGPMLAINCGAFTDELLANELFGHEKGAFTGADRVKIGLIEAAHGGTLFLDEVAEMSLAMQVKLLRVIQEKEVLRLGATRAQPIDVRFIAATNRDLATMVQEGHFRKDLYYRINVVHLHIPPLVARPNDILLLAHFFLYKYANSMNKKVTGIDSDAAEILKSYAYPGNVRELENLMERAVVFTKKELIGAEDLPDLAVETFRPKKDRMPALEEQESSYIKWVLEQVGGNKKKAADILGIDRVSLWRKLKKMGVE
jgi:DNA-binding NtrC family response regulator